MTTTFVDQMDDLATAITTDTVLATTSLVTAVQNRPCIYVAPPTLDYAAATLTGRPIVRHTLVAISSRDAEDLEALAELVTLIDAAVDAVPQIEDAAPAAYALTADLVAPAYILTLTR